jgi:hypothetical protein
LWDEREGFIKGDFLFFLEECLVAVGSRMAGAEGHFRRGGISIEQ